MSSVSIQMPEGMVNGMGEGDRFHVPHAPQMNRNQYLGDLLLARLRFSLEPPWLEHRRLRSSLSMRYGTALTEPLFMSSWDIIGDTLDCTVQWKQRTDLSALTEGPVRLRFVMKDADLFARQFTN